MSKWIMKSEPETWSWDSQVSGKKIIPFLSVFENIHNINGVGFFVYIDPRPFIDSYFDQNFRQSYRLGWRTKPSSSGQFKEYEKW